MPNFGLLAPEILSDIFLYVSHSSRRHSSFDWSDNVLENSDAIFLEPSSGSRPCKLSGVCKHWYRTALSTPRLWANIKLQVGFVWANCRKLHSYPHVSPWWVIPNTYPPMLEDFPENEEEWVRYWNLVVLWLKRSRNVPLRLYVTLFPNKSLPFALLETVTR